MNKPNKQEQLTCAKCGETKPRAEFKRRLTAQEYGRILHRPIKTGTTVISKNCKACQPKRKPRSKLTLKELRNKITSKAINAYLGESLIQQKRKNINDRRKRVMREYWQKQKGKERDKLKALLDKEVNRAKNTYHSYKRRTETCPIKTTRQTKADTPEQVEQIRQNRLAHLAVLQTQYKLSQERRTEELDKYDRDRNLSSK
jgi:septum formation inhibitor MinC